MNKPVKHNRNEIRRISFEDIFIILIIFTAVIIPAALGNGNNERPWDWQVTTDLRPQAYYLPNEIITVRCNVTPSPSIVVDKTNLLMRVTYGSNIIYSDSPMQLVRNQTKINGIGYIDLSTMNMLNALNKQESLIQPAFA